MIPLWITKTLSAFFIAIAALMPAFCDGPKRADQPYLCNALIYQPPPDGHPEVGPWLPWDTTGHTRQQWWFVCHTMVVLTKASPSGYPQANGPLEVWVTLEPPPLTGVPRYIAWDLVDLRKPEMWDKVHFRAR